MEVSDVAAAAVIFFQVPPSLASSVRPPGVLGGGGGGEDVSLQWKARVSEKEPVSFAPKPDRLISQIPARVCAVLSVWPTQAPFVGVSESLETYSHGLSG